MGNIIRNSVPCQPRTLAREQGLLRALRLFSDIFQNFLIFSFYTRHCTVRINPQERKEVFLRLCNFLNGHILQSPHQAKP